MTDDPNNQNSPPIRHNYTCLYDQDGRLIENESFELPPGVPSITAMDEAARSRSFSYAVHAGELDAWIAHFDPYNFRDRS